MNLKTQYGDQVRGAAGLACAKGWIALALLVLVFAGAFAFAVVIGRMPPFDRFVTDPGYFKRCLVAHVNFALVAWFYSFLVGLLFLLPARAATRTGDTPTEASDYIGWFSRNSVYVAGVGVLAMLVGALVPGSQPILSNYIPTIDNLFFKTGQILFGVSVVLSFLDRRIFWSPADGVSAFEMPAAAKAGLRVAALVFVLAAITFIISTFTQRPGLEVAVHYELLVWGVGHVLQLVCVIAMVAIWLILLESALGASPVSARAGTMLFAALALPWVIAPLLALQGTGTAAYRNGFTSLMQWCIFPVVTIFLILCIQFLVAAARAGRLHARDWLDPRLSGFAVSAGLTLLGFGLGAMIRGSNTIVPAHYHAAVGGVTVAFMALTFPLLEVFGFRFVSTRLSKAAGLQPILYGGGMLLFAAGFALAGAHGMGRKAYGAEQATRSFVETIGLGMMGVGGLVAIAGGLLFLGIVATVGWGGTRGSENQIKLEESKGRWRHGVGRAG